MPESGFVTELKVPAEPAFATLVDAFAADAARRAQLDERRQRATVEAARCGFAVIAGAECSDAREPVRIVASSTPLELTLSFFERGLPMDDSFARRDLKWNELCACVDSAHWRVHGAAGSELRLLVGRAGTIAANGDSPSAQPVAVLPAPEQEYTIRRFESADAVGVARAFYLTYGYAYDLGAVYSPQRLIALNESGRYLSIVAVTSDGDVAGHYALAREDGAPIADACGAIVLPAHRGRDLLNRLRDYAEAQARALGLAAYYSEPVTDHPRTQHASESFGAKACGITLGEAPRSFLARHMELSATSQRQSCMLYVKVLEPRAIRTIYAPPRHRAMIARIYEELGLPVSFAQKAASRGNGIVHTTITRADGIGTIAIRAIDVQTPRLAIQALDDLRATRRLGAIYAELPLEDPGTPAVCDALESRGFFFSGVGPWMLGGEDALRLQMPQTPIDLSALVVIGEFGRTLLGYVAAERERCAHRATMAP